MFKHILLPVDGSDSSLRAVDIGIALAASLGARVFAFHVAAPFSAVTHLAGALLGSQQEIFATDVAARAERYLAEVHRRAGAAGVVCDGGYVFDHRPYTAIVGAAKLHHCDLIVMASGRWHGSDRLPLGDETHRVILNCDVPVLVCH